MTGNHANSDALILSQDSLNDELQQSFFLGKPKRLKEFLHEIFHKKPREGICYEKLIHILTKSLLQRDQTPNDVFDWSRFQAVENIIDLN